MSTTDLLSESKKNPEAQETLNRIITKSNFEYGYCDAVRPPMERVKQNTNKRHELTKSILSQSPKPFLKTTNFSESSFAERRTLCATKLFCYTDNRFSILFSENKKLTAKAKRWISFFQN